MSDYPPGWEDPRFTLGENADVRYPVPTDPAHYCRRKVARFTRDIYCAAHGREAGWPCAVTGTGYPQ